MLIDTHAHVNFADFKEDADEVIRRALDNDTWMILVGSEYKTSTRALNYANKYQKGVYAAVGLHPTHLEDQRVENNTDEGKYNFVTRAEDFYYDNYEKLAKFEKVVAIGEIGLDYYHIDPTKDAREIKQKQQQVMLQQLLLARQLDLPVIIHCRQAHDDLLALLQDFRKVYANIIPNDRPWGVIHCFSGDEDLAWEYFGLGLLISFTGLITFSQTWDDLIRKVPIEKIMIETDSPYLAPVPYRGKLNQPAYVKHVAEEIALLRGISVAEVGRQTSENFARLFNL